MTEHLLYGPPKSAGFGHRSRVRNTRNAWQQTQSFLEKHTLGGFRSTERIRLHCYGSDKSTLDELESAFGKPTSFQEAATYSQFQAWCLDDTTIPQLTDIYFRAPGFPRQDGTHIRFDVCYDFRWRIDDGICAGSHLGIIFDRDGIFLQPTFAFPFAWDSPIDRARLEVILADAPFRFREQYFKRAILTKAGNSYRRLKLDSGWLSSAPQLSR